MVPDAVFSWVCLVSHAQARPKGQRRTLLQSQEWWLRRDTQTASGFSHCNQLSSVELKVLKGMYTSTTPAPFLQSWLFCLGLQNTEQNRKTKGREQGDLGWGISVSRCPAMEWLKGDPSKRRIGLQAAPVITAKMSSLGKEVTVLFTLALRQ